MKKYFKIKIFRSYLPNDSNDLILQKEQEMWYFNSLIK